MGLNPQPQYEESHALLSRQVPLLTTLLTPNMWGFILYQVVYQLSGHQLDVLQLNSILVLTAWSSCRLSKFSAQSRRIAPHFRHQSQVPGCHLHFGPIGYKLEVPTTPFSGLIICYNSSQNLGKHFIYYYWFVIKDATQEQPNGRNAEGKIMREGVQIFTVLFGHIILLAL